MKNFSSIFAGIRCIGYVEDFVGKQFLDLDGNCLYFALTGKADKKSKGK
ncbi:hypothetical protein [[Clostridium] polysaccharolyticum]|nr:hypothetical protein [[Clostridium] polysaccharolyticum]